MKDSFSESVGVVNDQSHRFLAVSRHARYNIFAEEFATLYLFTSV